MDNTTTTTGGDSEAFTPAEAAYFTSRGTDTSALDAEIAGNGSGEPAGGQQQPTGNQPGQDQNASQDGQEGQDDGDLGEDDELITVGPDGKPRGKGGRFVPHQALHKERERHKMTKAELDSVREKQARADERLTVLNDILKQAEAPAPGTQKPGAPAARKLSEIDPATQPLEALQAALAEIQRLEGEMTGQKTQAQERESAKAMQTAYQNDAVRHLQEKPEFKDAYKFLIDGRHRELEAMGMADVGERNRFIANEERQIVANAFQARRSPAQMLHNLAVARGFAAKAAPAPQSDPVKKIEQIANGQRQAGASLSGAGGSSGEGLTAAALADMNEEEFAAVAAKIGKSKLKQLMGG